MNKNLDLTKILKDCPKGTEFYSRCLGVVKFESINDALKCIILKNQKETVYYKENGVYYYADENAEIDLFPSKDQRDWSKWHIPFKDGDIIFSQLEDKWVSIFKEYSNEKCVTYVDLNIEKNNYFDDTQCLCEISEIKEQRLATEEEKQKLFQAIKDNGYKWNAETKTLEKLIVPKFKVGDTIRTKDGLQTYEITNVTSEYYSVLMHEHNCMGVLSVKYQDKWILISNKFDPKTLKPFDEVLVRDREQGDWRINWFSHFNYNENSCKRYYCLYDILYKYCIPYNDDTKYLVNTNYEAPEYYRC